MFRISTWDFSVIDLLRLILGGYRPASMSESALRVSFFGSCYCAVCYGILLSLLQHSFLYGYQSPCHNYPYCRTRRWRFQICTCATQFVQPLPRYYTNRTLACISQALLPICSILLTWLEKLGRRLFKDLCSTRSAFSACLSYTSLVAKFNCLIIQILLRMEK